MNKQKGGQMVKQRGQAAMEFLMTYGWAILAAIIAIGVLAYFGVFSPGKLVAGAATVSAPFGVSDYNILSTGTNDGTVNLNLIQNSGDGIQNGATVKITGTGSMSGTDCEATTTDNPWKSGDTVELTLACSNGVAGDSMASGDAFAGNIVVTYKKVGSELAQAASGSIRGTAQ